MEDAILDIVILDTNPAISDCNESDQLHLVDDESQTLVDGQTHGQIYERESISNNILITS